VIHEKLETAEERAILTGALQFSSAAALNKQH